MFKPGAVGMWDASVDYLRLTHRREGNAVEIANRYAKAVETVGRVGGGEGDTEEAWDWRGYRGVRLGSAAWGEHDASIIFQVSGGAARPGRTLGLPYTNVPRLDLQITFWLTSEDASVARRCSELAASYEPARKGRRPKVRHIDGYGDGDTSYIGSRGKKSKFLRCYDKWHESEKDEQYEHAWRFEAELTDDHAVNAWGALLDLPDTVYTIYALVAGYYAERGVTLPGAEGIRPIVPERLPVDEGSNARRLRWLQSQVGPTVHKLHANGVRMQDIVEALGLTREDVLRAYLHHAL